MLRLIVKISMPGYLLPFVTASFEIGESFGTWEYLGAELDK